MTKKLTPTQRKALEIIRDNNIVYAKQFGLFMWPDNPRWLTMSKSKGIKGCGMQLLSGGYLGKLAKKGLIGGTGNGDRSYYLTKLGREMLENESL